MHHLHQLRRDGKPKTGTAVATCHGGVGLLEGVEDSGLRLCGYAYAGIANRKLERHAIVELRLSFRQRHIDEHFAFVGELDSVAGKIDEDLPKPRRITDQAVRDLRIDPAG